MALIPTVPNGTFVFSVHDRKSSESEQISLHSELKAGFDYFCMTERGHNIGNDGLNLTIMNYSLMVNKF